MRILTVILAFTLSGCASMSTGTMNRIMSSWEGQPIDKVVVKWGYPDETKEFNGRKLYVWHHNKSAYIPQSSTTTGSFVGDTYYGQTNTYGGYTIQGACTRILEVDDKGNVTRWEWKGNNCPFAEWMEYAQWRNK